MKIDTEIKNILKAKGFKIDLSKRIVKKRNAIKIECSKCANGTREHIELSTYNYKGKVFKRVLDFVKCSVNGKDMLINANCPYFQYYPTN